MKRKSTRMELTLSWEREHLTVVTVFLRRQWYRQVFPRKMAMSTRGSRFNYIFDQLPSAVKMSILDRANHKGKNPRRCTHALCTRPRRNFVTVYLCLMRCGNDWLWGTSSGMVGWLCGCGRMHIVSFLSSGNELVLRTWRSMFDSGRICSNEMKSIISIGNGRSRLNTWTNDFTALFWDNTMTRRFL